jgi:hypothetical protein
VGLRPRHLPRGQTKSNILTGQCDDVNNEIHLQIDLKSDDSLQIGSSECGEKIQEIKASQRVPAPLSFDPRSIAGGESGRRRMQ